MYELLQKALQSDDGYKFFIDLLDKLAVEFDRHRPSGALFDLAIRLRMILCPAYAQQIKNQELNPSDLQHINSQTFQDWKTIVHYQKLRNMDLAALNQETLERAPVSS